MIKIKLGGYVDETGKIMNKQELDEHIVMLQENLTIAIEALEYYSEQSHCELHDINKARDALVKISANNIVTKYHNTLKNLKD